MAATDYHEVLTVVHTDDMSRTPNERRMLEFVAGIRRLEQCLQRPLNPESPKPQNPSNMKILESPKPQNPLVMKH